MKKISFVALIGLMMAAIAGGPAIAGSLATLEVGPVGIEWQPAAAETALTLTVSGPEGFYLRQKFASGEQPTFSAFDAEGNLRPTGIYVWELRAGGALDESTREELAPLREAGDVSAVRKALQRSDGSGYATGSFSILDGQIVAGGLEEERPADSGNGNTLSMKVIHNDNAIIRNAMCVGFDCPNAPAFGDSSVLMMENNNRIKFGDTSNAPFPNNDWEIEANSASNGGQSYLGFNDCGTADNDGGCATDLVFAVEAGVRQNALYVESDGDVGVGTANPVVRMHLVDGDTAALRLEQDGSSGFAPQIWDVAGNETSFFVRDATNGSTLPFRVFPTASSNSLVVAASDNVGVGTVSPDEALDVERNGNVSVRLTKGDIGRVWNITNDGPIKLNEATDPDAEFSLTQGGNLTIQGTITTSGSCSGGCDRVFSPDYDLESIEEHADAMWASMHLPSVGPTPENGPFNLSEKVGGMLNELEKAHIYIAQLNAEKNAEIDSLQAQIEELKKQLRELAER